MKCLYTLGIIIYNFLIRLASVFNSKARKLLRGRRSTLSKIRKSIFPGDRVFWFHCASLGEFEQGRPIIEIIKKKSPEIKVLLSFYSPSGYEVRSDYDNADCVVYLPVDTPWCASEFIKTVNPEKAVFIKYEFWYNFISILQKKNIPVYLVSGIFRKSQPFFRYYGAFFRKKLAGFKHLYIQDENSAELLKNFGIANYSVCGDTRFDRVKEISLKATELPGVEAFKGGDKLLVAGSSWPEEEEMLADYVNNDSGELKIVIAPHEIHYSNISRLEKLFKVKTIRYSNYSIDSGRDAKVLIIDNIGLLSSIYKYADLALIGGGFGKGIHNILEAATWGIPVLFGPNYKKFKEAIDLIGLGGAISFNSGQQFNAIIDDFIRDEDKLIESGKAAYTFVQKNLGASELISSDLLTESC